MPFPIDTFRRRMFTLDCKSEVNEIEAGLEIRMHRHFSDGRVKGETTRYCNFALWYMQFNNSFSDVVMTGQAGPWHIYHATFDPELLNPTT